MKPIKLDITKIVPKGILFDNFLKITKYASTQKALDTFGFFASISTLLTVSHRFCFVKVVVEKTYTYIFLVMNSGMFNGATMG